MVGDVVERCQTGIVGYDLISQGGFVRNSSNVFVGGPGSGKTTFLLEFLYNGVTKYGENGLFCSFEPDILDTLNDAFAHGWDFYKLAEEGKIKFIKFSPETSIDELKNELTRLISQNDIKRICFDPVSVLALNISERGKIRERVFDLVSLMKRLRVTSILSDESMESEGMDGFREGEWTKTDIIRFLSDSVSVLYTNGLTGDADRAIKIEKMRRTNHVRKLIGMRITDNGIEVLSPPGQASIVQAQPAPARQPAPAQAR
jgi:circadian clock protein KaiC